MIEIHEGLNPSFELFYRFAVLIYLGMAASWVIGRDAIKQRPARSESDDPIQTGLMLLAYSGGCIVLLGVGIGMVALAIRATDPGHYGA